MTGGGDPAAPAEANIGTLVPGRQPRRRGAGAGLVAAECTGRGYLSLGEDALSMGDYVLPGNNYHVYDYALFWANLRADAERRVDAYLAR